MTDNDNDHDNDNDGFSWHPSESHSPHMVLSSRIKEWCKVMYKTMEFLALLMQLQWYAIARHWGWTDWALIKEWGWLKTVFHWSFSPHGNVMPPICPCLLRCFYEMGHGFHRKWGPLWFTAVVGLQNKGLQLAWPWPELNGIFYAWALEKIWMEHLLPQSCHVHLTTDLCSEQHMTDLCSIVLFPPSILQRNTWKNGTQ